ncbi:MAG: glycosyltransferase family 39 protein [Patescibacteria group bacterium]
MFDAQRIVSFFKKSFSGKDLLIVCALIFLYIITRVINLEELPIFNDEGIYIHWAKVAWHDAAWRFISLTDGKQPLQTWGTIPFLKLFPENALYAGRLFSVATGFFALLGMFSLLFYLFGKKTAQIGSLLYIFIPYFVFYDRIALIDSGVNAFFIWILFFSILLARTMRLDVALIFGLVAGMGLLAKSSVRVFVGLSILAPVVMKDVLKKPKTRRLISFLFLFFVMGIIAGAIYNVQRLSPFLHFVEEKNKTFIMTFDELWQNPLAVLFHNIKIVPYYVFSELGWVIVPFGFLGLYHMFRNNFKIFVYLLLWIFIPYIGISLMTKVLFPRYIIFFGSLVVILASYFLGTLKNKKRFVAVFVFILVAALYFDYFMWFDYKGIIFPAIDRGQYVEGITVGYGAKEIIEYAREKTKEKPVVILAEGNFGMSGDILDTFLRPSDRISIVGYWPLDEKEILSHQWELEGKFVYVVLSHKKDVPQNWPVKLIRSYYKPNRQTAMHLLELGR